MTFGIIGVGGYIAPRHLKAIKENNCELVVACDINDSVGVIDKYFKNAKFFNNELDFFSFVKNNKVDFVSITSPNFLHLHHINLALESNSFVICEKPLVLNVKELDSIKNQNVFTILQLRLHPNAIALKHKINKELALNPNKIYNIDLSYITGRGDWYLKSWKGDSKKSGGLVCNIGIHFFDLLIYLFGEVRDSRLLESNELKARGILNLKNAKVSWFLSIDFNDLENIESSTFRELKIDNECFDFSNGFEDLHTLSYKEILNNNGFGLDSARASIELIENLKH